MNILVCVTQQRTCERLIIKAIALRNEYKGEIHVIHVAQDGLNFLDNPKEGEALQYLFEISKSIGADLSVLKSDNIIKCIADFAQKNGINSIVIGKSLQDHTDSIFYKKLRSLLGDDIDIIVVP